MSVGGLCQSYVKFCRLCQNNCYTHVALCVALCSVIVVESAPLGINFFFFFLIREGVKTFTCLLNFYPLSACEGVISDHTLCDMISRLRTI